MMVIRNKCFGNHIQLYGSITIGFDILYVVYFHLTLICNYKKVTGKRQIKLDIYYNIINKVNN